MNIYKICQTAEHISDVLIGEFININVKLSPLKYGINMEESRKTKIILSLTTYNKRYETINLTLKSLLLQTIKPDRIIVWLDEDTPENEITPYMRELEQYGVEYRHTTLGLKPHNKYFHAMQEFPNDIIITVDDDIIYPPNTIEVLMKTHEKYPHAVCTRRAHLITLDKNGNLKKYKEWKYEYRRLKTPSYLLCATGVAGTLYPPHTLPPEAFNVENIKKYCHNADDIWLKIMEVKNGIKVVWAENHLVLPKGAKDSQQYTLCEKNVIGGENDTYIQILQEKYPAVFSFIAECAD